MPWERSSPAAVVVLVAIIDIADISRAAGENDLGGLVTVNVGIGLILTLVAGAVGVGAAIMALVRKPSSASAPAGSTPDARAADAVDERGSPSGRSTVVVRSEPDSSEPDGSEPDSSDVHDGFADSDFSTTGTTSGSTVDATTVTVDATTLTVDAAGPRCRVVPDPAADGAARRTDGRADLLTGSGGRTYRGGRSINHSIGPPGAIGCSRVTSNPKLR